MTELIAIVDAGWGLDWFGFWRGPEAGRLDWFGTGAFLACCLVAAWWTALRFPGRGFWVSVILSMPLGMWRDGEFSSQALVLKRLIQQNCGKNMCIGLCINNL